MGKRYYCDYCDKTMDSSPAIVKKHNKGMIHNQLVQSHYQKFKDPETILAEESCKKPCIRFLKGQCQFGAVCHFSHYNEEQIMALKEHVASKQARKKEFDQPSFQDLYQRLQTEKASKLSNSEDRTTVIYDSNGVTHVFPWIYNEEFESYGENLPPSLRKFNANDFVNMEINEWG